MFKVKIEEYLENEHKNIKLQIAVLCILGLASILLGSLSISKFNDPTVGTIKNNIYFALSLLSTSTYFISIIVLHIYMKFKRTKIMLYAYLLIFISYVLQKNVLLIFLMGLYLFKFFKKNNKETINNNSRSRESIIAFSVSLIVLITSLIIFYIQLVVR